MRIETEISGSIGLIELDAILATIGVSGDDLRGIRVAAFPPGVGHQIRPGLVYVENVVGMVTAAASLHRGAEHQHSVADERVYQSDIAGVGNDDLVLYKAV